MAFDLALIDLAAKKIRRQIASGEICEACGMSAVATPVTEAWDTAQTLAENAKLSSAQQQSLLKALTPETQQRLASGYDDFDLIYERLLTLINTG